MANSPERQLLTLNQELLDSIDQQDWPKYTSLVDSTLSSFEPEGRGHLIQGLQFHRFYFMLEKTTAPKQSIISSPNVRIIGDVAIVSYVRLVQQQLQNDDSVSVVATEETRVWQKKDGNWRNVHFHRSLPAA